MSSTHVVWKVYDSSKFKSNDRYLYIEMNAPNRSAAPKVSARIKRELTPYLGMGRVLLDVVGALEDTHGRACFRKGEFLGLGQLNLVPAAPSPRDSHHQ